MKDVTDTIQQALSAAGLDQRVATQNPHGVIRDGVVGEAVVRKLLTAHDLSDRAPITPTASAEPARPGEFVSRTFTNYAGTRSYKLYVPVSYAGTLNPAVPLVVMLHGCTQSPDDFATGTRMNTLAEQHGFLVAYPAQAANANGSKCWNWFRPEDQHRDRGEPAIIAGITRQVIAHYHVDTRRIYVAGLSAGAAMAVVLGATYPELYAAVGAHSGLPYGAAHDVPSAFGAMKSGSPLAGMRTLAAAPMPPRLQIAHGVPTIVFHGDRDVTVDPRNGAAIIKQAILPYADASPLRSSVQEGVAGGATYRRVVYTDAADRPVVEQWVLHGAGHAWSGGNPNGSFTSAAGPDASAEMIRFFNAQH